MKRMQFDVVKRNFDDVLLLVGNGRQRIIIQDGNRDRAAFISLEDLALLENLDGDANIAVEHLSAGDLKKHLGEDLEQVAGRKERIIVRQDGKEVAALVPGRDLAVLQNLDNRLDLEAAKRLLKKKLDEDG